VGEADEPAQRCNPTNEITNIYRYHQVPLAGKRLLDVIGELKRHSLRLIERGGYEESLKVFDIAESVFNQVEELAFAENIIPGLKRKLDIYRKVLDDWKELLIDIISREKLRKVLEGTKTSRRVAEDEMMDG